MMHHIHCCTFYCVLYRQEKAFLTDFCSTHGLSAATQRILHYEALTSEPAISALSHRQVTNLNLPDGQDATMRRVAASLNFKYAIAIWYYRYYIMFAK